MPVHLNTAGAGLMPAEVVDTMTAHLTEEAAEGAYETELRHTDTLEKGVYEALAQLLDAPVDDMAVFDSATRAWSSAVSALRLTGADRVWITPYEYAGGLILWTELRRRTGLRVEVVPLTSSGDLDLDWMRRNIREDVAVVSVPHVPSGCGIVNPVEEIGRILAPWPCLYLVDACQSVGQLDVSVRKIGCDLLTGAGRKFLCGPRGTGFAAIGPRLRAAAAPMFHDLHVADVTSANDYAVHTEGARRFEYAERSAAAVRGLDAALRHHLARPASPGTGPGTRDAVRSIVDELPDTRLVDPGTRHASIVTFVCERLPAARIRAELAARDVNVWVAQGNHTPLYLPGQGVDHGVRVSPHHYTSPQDIEVFARALREVIR
ncbi:aminotransferase [Streptomyces sp. WAC 05379]|uniref:aminotransferase class V-fold PLP-dependent enzyme n=1 Tax=Streptomyces sp. WAC 05379 TaxID=2203207 RepID=UPI000F7479A2|nr:aminotransferase class V-fold PLP-dependent enzyme [Streptomyces sp. WAC 05379]RSO05747.1 aminotransferase [Streptomyces sp. WAC 05379]